MIKKETCETVRQEMHFEKDKRDQSKWICIVFTLCLDTFTFVDKLFLCKSLSNNHVYSSL